MKYHVAITNEEDSYELIQSAFQDILTEKKHQGRKITYSMLIAMKGKIRNEDIIRDGDILG